MKGAVGDAVGMRHVEAVVAETLSHTDRWFLADDAVALNHLLVPVAIPQHPLSTIQGHLPIGHIGDGDKVDERVGRAARQFLLVMKIDNAVELGTEAG